MLQTCWSACTFRQTKGNTAVPGESRKYAGKCEFEWSTVTRLAASHFPQTMVVIIIIVIIITSSSSSSSSSSCNSSSSSSSSSSRSTPQILSSMAHLSRSTAA